MATGQPQTIGEALFTQVTGLFEKAEPVSEFVISRLKRDADKLQAVDAVEASVVKSALAAFEWNFEEADRWVKNAVALRKSAVNFQNAAVTMRALNKFSQAREYSLQAAACAPSDVTVIFKAATSLVLAGNISEAYELVSPLRGTSGALNEIAIELEELQQSMANLGVSESRIMKEMEVASEVASANKIRISSAGHFVADDPDGGKSIYIPLKFIGDIDTELRLEADLSAKLSTDSQWDPLKLSVEFAYE